jgi:lipoyl(octanoyl) transferase
VTVSEGRAGPGGTWRLLDTGAGDGAWNMAVDEALMESVRHGAAPTLRFYRWSPLCVSLGRNQPTRVEDGERYHAAGIGCVRRITGGRALLHDRELTYSVVAPARLLGSARSAYRIINEVLVDGLGRLGVGAAVHDSGRRPPLPSTAPCFAEPVAGEVLAAGRKLLGSAQTTIEGVLLQHGSLPFSPPAPAVAAVVETGAPAYLEPLLGRPCLWSEVTGAIVAAWERRLGPALPTQLDPVEGALAAVLADRYASDGWTWRR